jgi:hypothetical protein
MKYLLTILLIFTLERSYAQLDGYSFVDEGMIFKLFEPRYLFINTLDVPPDSALNAKGFTVRSFTMERVTFDQFGYQASHRFSLISEALSAIAISMIKGGDFDWAYQRHSTEISGYILGWHNHVVNVVSLEDVNVAVGGHWGDYFLAYSPYTPGSDPRSNLAFGTVREPAGWYGALGPVLMLDYNLLDVVNLHFEGSYAFTAKFMDAVDMEWDRSYPNPHFLNFSLQARPDYFLYGGIEHIRSINRGDHPFNATRTDFFIGFWF